MRFRFTPLVRKFSKFANIVIKDFIQSARNLKCLKKEFPELKTGYDYAIAYISHFSKLKRKNTLFQKQYKVDFGNCKNDLYVMLCKKDKSGSRADFQPEGIILSNNKLIPLLNIFLDKIKCSKLKSLRKRFNYIESIRRYIVHELAHCYQFLKLGAFDENDFYVVPDKSSKYFLLESFLYMLQGEELEAMLYESLHTYNVERHKRSVAEIFITYLADEIEYMKENYTLKEFFDYVDNNGPYSGRILCDYIFNVYLPKTKFAKYFKDIKCKSVDNAFKIIDELLDVYKNIADGLPISKKFVSGCKNSFAFNNLLEEL